MGCALGHAVACQIGAQHCAAKEVAQIGAAIAREFSYPLLAAAMRRPEPELREALNRLNAGKEEVRRGNRISEPFALDCCGAMG